MYDRKVHCEERFPHRRDKEGNTLCRVCGKICRKPRRWFCSKECVRTIGLLTNWNALRKYILKRDKYICKMCGNKATHVDHIIPISKGGAMWDMDNLQASCAKCNLSKGSKTLEEFKSAKSESAPVLYGEEL